MKFSEISVIFDQICYGGSNKVTYKISGKSLKVIHKNEIASLTWVAVNWN